MFVTKEEERIEKTKPQIGKIALIFENKGDSFQIKFKDDGGGINPTVIKNKLIEKGLKSENDLKEKTTIEILNMIFLPGFSTKDEVSSISGRGVGMDAVKNEVEKLKGTIDIFSEIDEGTVFTINLPLNMSS